MVTFPYNATGHDLAYLHIALLYNRAEFLYSCIEQFSNPCKMADLEKICETDEILGKKGYQKYNG
jgi:hypothetical protein